MQPEKRNDELVIEYVADELVVYDLRQHRAHRLNRTTALVWEYCDGHTTVDDMAKVLATDLNVEANEELVWLALE